MELSEELEVAVRDLGGAAGRSEAQAVQVAESRTKEDALAALLGLIGHSIEVRDAAVDLYTRLIEWDGEG